MDKCLWPSYILAYVVNHDYGKFSYILSPSLTKWENDDQLHHGTEEPTAYWSSESCSILWVCLDRFHLVCLACLIHNWKFKQQGLIVKLPVVAGEAMRKNSLMVAVWTSAVTMETSVAVSQTVNRTTARASSTTHRCMSKRLWFNTPQRYSHMRAYSSGTTARK